MGRVILVIVILSMSIYAVTEVAQSERFRVRSMPKWMWALAVIFIPVAGPLFWFVFGRPVADRPIQRDIPPDDDPDFLRKLR
ncbi:MAG TPA: PLD nuclease N-terminal domain-containing protein [Propionibacteriaceae bacterium]|nr:PLD nuclease N-terminal domain-containing protein [Propionibacteriaceae bacterium]